MNQNKQRSSKEPAPHRADAGDTLVTLAAPKLGDAAAPTEVVLAPWGAVQSMAGDFVVDAESGAAVAAAFAAHGADLPIDFEHQTLGGAYAAPDGKAPAAGWITALSVRPDIGIVGRVNWTDAGRKLIEEKAYRYLSPVALIRKADRKLVALHSVALTNKPAIVGMPAIINRAAPPPSPAETEVELAALYTRLDVAVGADAATLLTAAVARLDALESDARQREAEALVAALAEEGKLTAAQRDWAIALALADRALFDVWAQTAPVVVPLGRLDPPAIDGGAGVEALAASARREYRASPTLQQLTSEEAYVAAAQREHAADIQA